MQINTQRIFKLRIKICKIRKIRKINTQKKYADNMQNAKNMHKIHKKNTQKNIQNTHYNMQKYAKYANKYAINTQNSTQKIFKIRIKICIIRKICKIIRKEYAENMQNMQKRKNMHKLRK